MKIHSTNMSAICFLSYEYSFLSEDLKILLPSSELSKADSSICLYRFCVVKLLGFLLCVFKCSVLLSTFLNAKVRLGALICIIYFYTFK